MEEALQNVPAGLQEVDIDTQAGSSCYYRLERDERYVIFTDRREGSGSFSIAACSNTFNVRGSEHILDALRNQVKGGPPRLLGTVLRSTGEYLRNGGVAGVSVIAEAGDFRQEAITDGFGRYEFQGLPPNSYKIEVLKDGYVADSDFNHRPSGLILNPSTHAIEPEKDLRVSKNSCKIRDLAMWPDGKISGTVRGVDRHLLNGITVQAFAFNLRGERESSPLRSTTSGVDGTYTLDRLPEGNYVIGVNAQTYRDDNPYPPTVYTTGEGSTTPARVRVAESQTVNGIDLALPPERVAMQLRVNVVGPDGAPYSDALITLDNLAGVQRWYSREKTNADGWTEVPVYLDEHYVVRAFDFGSLSRPPKGLEHLEGSVHLHVTAGKPSVTVTLGPKNLLR